MTLDYQAAKDAGYSDDEIKNFVSAQPHIQVTNTPSSNPTLDLLQGAVKMLAPQTSKTLGQAPALAQRAQARRDQTPAGNLNASLQTAGANTADLAGSTINPQQLSELASFVLPGGAVEGKAASLLGKALPGTVGAMAAKIGAKLAPGTASGALQGASTGNPSNIAPDAALGNLGTVLRGIQHPIAPLGQEVDRILQANPAQLDTQSLRSAFSQGPQQHLYQQGYGDQTTKAGNDVFSGLRQAIDSYNRGGPVLDHTNAMNTNMIPDSIGLASANSYKRNLYRTAAGSYGGDTGKAGPEAQKGLASVLKQAIEQKAPQVQPYNQLMSLLYKAPDAASTVASSIPGIGKLLEKVAATPTQWLVQHAPTQNPLSRFLLQYGGPAAQNALHQPGQ